MSQVFVDTKIHKRALEHVKESLLSLQSLMRGIDMNQEERLIYEAMFYKYCVAHNECVKMVQDLMDLGEAVH